MYLWNINKLVNDLKNNKLSTRYIRLFSALTPLLSIFNAIFFGVILISHQIISQVFAYFISTPDPNFIFYNNLGWFMGTVATCFTFVGFYLCYRTNQQGDGKNFFTRMACLSFPIYFNLTLYIIAILTIIVFFSFSFFLVKVLYFKYKLFTQIKASASLGESLQLALKDTPISNIIGQVSKKSGFLKAVFSTPGIILKIPLIPGKVSAFAKELRSSLFSIYPLLTLLPPALTLTHCLVVRRMLRKVCGAKK
jgi:hypothetical protein